MALIKYVCVKYSSRWICFKFLLHAVIQHGLHGVIVKNIEVESTGQFKRRTFHEPNLIRIWTDPN